MPERTPSRNVVSAITNPLAIINDSRISKSAARHTTNPPFLSKRFCPAATRITRFICLTISSMLVVETVIVVVSATVPPDISPAPKSVKEPCASNTASSIASFRSTPCLSASSIILEYLDCARSARSMKTGTTL